LMFPDLGLCGSIEDEGLGVCWEASTLAGEAAQRAAILARHRVGPGSVVAIAHSGSAFFFADLFAVWSVGAAAACLDGSLTDLELQNVIGFVKPAVVLVHRPKTSRTYDIPVLELAGSLVSEPSMEPTPAVKIDPEWPALILFTSGTTGNPKGVVLTYQALQTRIALNIAAIGPAVLRRALVTLPTHFGHGLIGNALTPLLSGGNIVLYSGGALRGDQLGRIIDRHAITFLSSVPAFWNLALRSSPPDGDSLLRVHVGSAPLSAKLWSEIASWSRAEVVNCLGMTETANWIAGASSRAEGIADGLVGKLWGGEAGVLSDHGAIRPTGTGEIVVRSPCLTSGYFKRPDLTAIVMIDGWLRTGDGGAIDDLGRIWLTGRIKDEINRAGFKVQPAEVDMVIEAHPGVAEACVFGIPDPVSGEVVGAAVRLKERAKADAAGLQAWCRERLRREAVPERWFMVDVIPRSARGKVNRDAVRRQVADVANGIDTRQAGAEADIAANSPGPLKIVPQTSSLSNVSAAVERAWTSILGRQSYRSNTPWDRAGGDSIGAMRLWLQIEQQLATSLPLELLEFNTTPSRLVGTIEKVLERSEQGAAVSSGHGQQPFIFLMPPAHGDTPALAQFRAACNGRVRFEVIRYPALEEFLDGGAAFDLLVDAAVAQIRAKGRIDAYYIAGYSFGGSVAWAAAARLLESGNEVPFLGLIDTHLAIMSKEPRSVFQKLKHYVQQMLPPRQEGTPKPAILFFTRELAASLWRARRDVYRDVRWWILEILARKCPWALLRRIDRLARALPGPAAVWFQWELTARLRANAFQWRTMEPLDVVATLFRSEERGGAGSIPDYGWGRVCKKLVMLPICGNHLSLFDPGNMEMLCTLFVRAVEAAEVGRRRSKTKISRTA
jgi:acyl-CoA synthetase (AMP-forming)/AMP-acid ligase II/thioesterase domain-containing protein